MLEDVFPCNFGIWTMSNGLTDQTDKGRNFQNFVKYEYYNKNQQVTTDKTIFSQYFPFINSRTYGLSSGAGPQMIPEILLLGIVYKILACHTLFGCFAFHKSPWRSN